MFDILLPLWCQKIYLFIFCCHCLSKTKTRANVSIFKDLECKIGDGIGGSEINTEELFSSLQECIDHVKENYPDANGVTFETSCTDSCECYAENAMYTWNTGEEFVNNYVSCKFSSC